SSSADLVLPAGATVQYALLQWGGNPADAPNPDLAGTVQLTPPGRPPVAITSTEVRTASGDAAYTARADVTPLLPGLAQPRGTYTVADVQTGDGPGQFGGWALIVLYRAPDDLTAPAPRQVLAVFDDPSPVPGRLTRLDSSAPMSFTLAGIPVPKTPRAV